MSIGARLEKLGGRALFGALYHLGRATGRYQTFSAAGYDRAKGPASRYPHLAIESFLEYRSHLDAFQLKNGVNSVQVINQILRNELFFYELFSPAAKRINLKDCLGYPASESAKMKAFVSLAYLYLENLARYLLGKNMFGAEIEVRDLALREISLQPGYEALGTYMRRSLEGATKLVVVKVPGPAEHLGVVLKGTNLTFVDETTAVQLGEIFHTIWHVEEGIRGFGNDNEYIVETWGQALWLFAHQAYKGRTERRLRKNVSPHDIKFRDYIALRAYVGGGIRSAAIAVGRGETIYYHGLYGLLSPTLKLVSHLLPAGQKDGIFIKALFEGEAPQVIAAVDGFLGEGAYREIYHNWDVLFHRLDLIRARAEKRGMDFTSICKIMFSSQEMLPTFLDQRLIALIWLSREINQQSDLVIDLIEDLHGAALRAPQREKITIEKWRAALLDQGKTAEAAVVGREAQKYKTLLAAF